MFRIISNLNDNLERAETYDEFVRIQRLLDIELYKLECQENFKKISKGLKRRNSYEETNASTIGISPNIVCMLAAASTSWIPKNSNNRMLSDHKLDRNWFFSFPYLIKSAY